MYSHNYTGHNHINNKAGVRRGLRSDVDLHVSPHVIPLVRTHARAYCRGHIRAHVSTRVTHTSVYALTALCRHVYRHSLRTRPDARLHTQTIKEKLSEIYDQLRVHDEAGP